MRFFLTGTCLLLFVPFTGIAQSAQSAARTNSFIKIWGFLKYHHQQIAKGDLNWDSVFVANVKPIENSKSKDDFNKVLERVINVAGGVENKNTSHIPDSLFTLNYTDSNKWIEASVLLNTEIKERLKNIYQNRNTGGNKYISIIHSTADFTGEGKYENIGFPGEPFRLLFLSRFWNIINYFAPYKYLVGEEWDNVLARFIPKFIKATDSVSYYKTLMELAKSLNDGHAGVEKSNDNSDLNELVFGKYTTPFLSDIMDDAVVIRKILDDSLCKSAGIRKGDIILKADRQPVRKIFENRRKYIAASNATQEKYALSRLLLDGDSPTVRLTIRRGARPFKTTVKRVSASESFQQHWRAIFNHTYNKDGYQLMRDSILLVYASQIWDGNLDTIRSMITRSKAVIFDVRNYPQGNNAFYNLFGSLLPGPKMIDYATVAMVESPGLFKWVPSPKIGAVNKNYYKGKVVILADERTQSQGEYSVMVFQTVPHTVTVGRQTAGADGVKTLIPMGGDLTISYSGYGIYYPDRSQTQRVGVRIDIPVKKTIQAVTSDRDDILERALEYITGKE